MKAFLLILLSLNAHAGLREKLKERFVQKMMEKPAPEASTDTSTKIEKPGTYTFKTNVFGVDRFYMVHVPKSYNSKSSVPLLFAIHGGGGNMKIQATDEFYKQVSKSEELGFIAVFPNGYSKYRSGSFATWNAGHCCGDARDKNITDVTFFRVMIKNVSAQLNIDPKKIYATGMSNGGMMSYRLACELSETFAGIASVAGTDNTKECAPTKAINILHIHALDDDHVNFNGGAGKKAASKEKITDYKSVPSTIAKWVEFNKCNPKSMRVMYRQGSYCDRYSECRDNVKVELCVTPSGGHSWPGGKNPFTKQETFQGLSANDVMWDFFKR